VTPPAPLAWPAALAGTPAVAVIERAIGRSRLAHALLLHGDDTGTLALVAQAIADRLLNFTPVARGTAPQYFPPDQHPDFFVLRPAGKMRQISAEPTRDLIAKVQVTPRLAARKVVVVHEADRMHAAAANIFLKTLEEPPADTTILLLTARPYALLATIRSRCLHFRFPADAAPLAHPDLAAWLGAYTAWLGRLVEGVTEKRAVADQLLAVYGLVTRFNTILAGLTAEAWETQKDKLPPDLDDDEQVAIETGIANGLRLKLFAELEHATRAFGQKRLLDGDNAARRALASAIERLERAAALLRYNLSESAALEDFLLSSLRIWSKR
jgi:DNA polymerase-3 subunit delta'